MKLDLNNPVHAAMIAKYLSSEMSPPERLEFENYLEADESNTRLMNEIEPSWSKMKGHPFRNPDTTRAWGALHTRLDEAGLIEHKDANLTMNRRWMLGIAAGLILLVGLGLMLQQMIAPFRTGNEVIQVKTGAENQTLIRSLSDGSIVYMAGNSTMSVPEQFSDRKRKVTFEGIAFFDIESMAGKPFVIETGHSTIEVIGTAFTVNTLGSKGIEVEVERGKVKVSLKSAPSKAEYVTAGEKISNSGTTLQKSSIDNSEIKKWYQQRMHFKDESVNNIVKVLNRNFHANFVLKDPGIGNKRLTVTFENETLDNMIQLICIPLNLESSRNGNTVILSEESKK